MQATILQPKPRPHTTLIITRPHYYTTLLTLCTNLIIHGVHRVEYTRKNKQGNVTHEYQTFARTSYNLLNTHKCKWLCQMLNELSIATGYDSFALFPGTLNIERR